MRGLGATAADSRNRRWNVGMRRTWTFSSTLVTEGHVHRGKTVSSFNFQRDLTSPVLPVQQGVPVWSSQGPGQQQSTKADSSAKLRTTVGQERPNRGRCNRLMQVAYRRKLKCICELYSTEHPAAICSHPASFISQYGL